MNRLYISICNEDDQFMNLPHESDEPVGDPKWSMNNEFLQLWVKTNYILVLGESLKDMNC